MPGQHVPREHRGVFGRAGDGVGGDEQPGKDPVEQPGRQVVNKMASHVAPDGCQDSFRPDATVGAAGLEGHWADAAWPAASMSYRTCSCE